MKSSLKGRDQQPRQRARGRPAAQQQLGCPPSGRARALGTVEGACRARARRRCSRARRRGWFRRKWKTCWRNWSSVGGAVSASRFRWPGLRVTLRSCRKKKKGSARTQLGFRGRLGSFPQGWAERNRRAEQHEVTSCANCGAMWEGQKTLQTKSSNSGNENRID